MDPVNIILMALGNATLAGSQAAISDAVKETLESLKKRIRQAFSGRPQAGMVLDEYEQNPDTWEKPLRDALIKTGLSQDTITVNMAQRLLELLESQAEEGVQINIQHVGTGYGSVYGTNNGVINVNAPRDKIAEGKAILKLGRDALKRGEYDAAKLHLEKAFQTLPEGQNQIEGAQARFLLALTLLNGKRPRSANYQTFRRIEGLMQSAITLYPSYSYLCTLVLIKRDYAWNGFAHLSDEADELVHHMKGITTTSQDQENFNLLRHCQPHLMQNA